MSAASYVAGILFLMISTIFRYISTKRNAALNITQPTHIIPKVDNSFLAIAQLMGILWIVLGYFLSVADKWFSSSAWGIILAPCIVFIPFILGIVILKALISFRKR